jgi:hypothetical protein
MHELENRVEKLYKNYGFEVIRDLYTPTEAIRIDPRELFRNIVKSQKFLMMDFFQQLDITGFWINPKDICELSEEIARSKFLEGQRNKYLIQRSLTEKKMENQNIDIFNKKKMNEIIERGEIKVDDWDGSPKLIKNEKTRSKYAKLREKSYKLCKKLFPNPEDKFIAIECLDVGDKLEQITAKLVLCPEKHKLVITSRRRAIPDPPDILFVSVKEIEEIIPKKYF